MSVTFLAQNKEFQNYFHRFPPFYTCFITIWNTVISDKELLSLIQKKAFIEVIIRIIYIVTNLLFEHFTPKSL